MNASEVISNQETAGASVAAMDMKLEAVVIRVSDVDRAKEFYGSLGWRLDADFRFENGKALADSINLSLFSDDYR